MTIKTVDAYIAKFAGWRADALISIRALVKETIPNVDEAIKWAQPVYSAENGPICFIKVYRKHINLGFWWGAKLEDPNGLLQGDGDKMRHIKITSLEDVQPVIFRKMIAAAAEANNTLGNPTQ